MLCLLFSFRRLAALFIVTGLFGAMLCGAVMNSASCPRLDVSPRKLDLGQGVPGSLVEGKIRLRNTGKGSLRFNSIASCGCTKVSPLSGELAAGDETCVTVVLTLPSTLGASKTTQVSFATSIPVVDKATCVITASVTSPFVVQPQSIDLGKIPIISLVDAKALCVVSQIEDAKLSGLQVLVARPFRAELTGNEIAVTIDPGAVEGHHAASLELSVNGDASSVFRIPVRAEVVAALVAIPSRLCMRNGNRGESQVADFFVSSMKPIHTLELLDETDDFALEQFGTLNEHQCRCRLIFAANNKSLAHPRRMRLRDVETGYVCMLTVTFPALNSMNDD